MLMASPCATLIIPTPLSMLHKTLHWQRRNRDRTSLILSFVKKISAFALALLVAGWAGCHQPGCGDSHDVDPPADRVLRIGGSTTLFPALEQGMALHRQSNPALEFELSQSSSGHGIARLIAGDLDIAAASRTPWPREFRRARNNAVALKTYQVALDGVAIIVHPEKATIVRSMNLAQARAIFFTGDITDWSLIDPRLNGPITVYSRDTSTSGTAAAFVSTVTGISSAEFVAGARRVDRTDHVIPTIAGDPAGIGFASLSQIDDTVAALAFGFDDNHLIAPSVQSVRDMRYQLRRDLFLITNGTPRAQINDFIRFMLSARGQEIFNQMKMISIY